MQLAKTRYREPSQATPAGTSCRSVSVAHLPGFRPGHFHPPTPRLLARTYTCSVRHCRAQAMTEERAVGALITRLVATSDSRRRDLEVWHLVAVSAVRPPPW